MKTNEDLVLKYQKGDIAALNELRSNVRYQVQGQVTRFINGPGHISRAAMEARADELLVDAAKTWKPGSAMFQTHLHNYLRRLDRYTKANANISKVPELKANMITSFTTQSSILQDQKGRAPTREELADHMQISLKTVDHMNRSMRREVPWSHVGIDHQANMEQARVNELLDDIEFELTPDERKVFVLIMGKSGAKKVTTGGDLARATGFSQAKVSMLRTSIAKKIQPHLGDQKVFTV